MPEQKPNAPGQPKSLTWQAPEFAENQKHPLWYLAFCLIDALIVMYAAYTGSWTMAVVFLLVGIVGVGYAARKPEAVTVLLDGVGVHFGGQTYSYQVIRKFGLVYNPDIKALYLETTAILHREVRIELGQQDPRPVREFLARYVDEDLEWTESPTEAIARKLRF